MDKMFRVIPYPRRLLAFVLLGALMLAALSAHAQADATSDGTNISAPSGIVVSAGSDRSDPRPIEEVSLSGNIFVFLDVSRNVKAVRFYLDNASANGTPFRTSDSYPFDLEGVNGSLALPFDSTSLDDGVYTLTASHELANRRIQVVHAQVVVANADEPVTAEPAPDPEPEPQPDPEPEPEPTPDPTPTPASDAEYGPRPVTPQGCDVWVSPSQDAREVVANQPTDATICFKAGTHRLTGTIQPHNGQKLLGEAGAILSGAKLLTNWTRDGSRWYVDGQAQRLHHTHADRCAVGNERCARGEKVFLDGAWLHHVSKLADLEPGSYFFDFDNDRIYLGTDPTGRTVEGTVIFSAIRSSGTDVTVAGLTIQMFGPHAQRGAIEVEGNRWTVEDNTIRLNHGVGIRTQHVIDSVVRRNQITQQGQLGIGGHGNNLVVEGNEISHNNKAGFRSGWEAGGSKWVRTKGLIVRENHVHDNHGMGLWTDFDNINTLYENNLSENNLREGIFHEVSYDAIIRNNTVRGNGFGNQNWCYGAGILVAHSPNVEVYGNHVTDNWNGIQGIQQARGSGTYGPFELRNLHVHGNTITISQRYARDASSNGANAAGICIDTGNMETFRSWGNRFLANQYSLLDDGGWWTWENRRRDWKAWREFGLDLSGSLAVQ